MTSRTLTHAGQIDECLSEFSSHLRNLGLCEDDVFMSRLALCELLTNVFRHGGDEAEVRFGVSDGVVSIEVFGGDLSSISEVTLPDAMAEAGRGLYLVSVICGGDMSIEKNAVSVRISVQKNR
ncbi:MAG: ATP-binding protein [Clostridia bacterium]|nr:ATP-binding protein [Clostridia bacterium]